MARIENPRINEALKIFRKRKVLSIDELVKIMQCSAANLRLKLKKWKAFTIYNFSGKYYCLPDIPSFDANGLWKHKDIYFSMHGTLKKTVVSLVENSSSGLFGKEISKIVGLSSSSFLHHFRNVKGLKRSKEGFYYLYFSDNHKRYNIQISNRISQQEKVTLPSDADAVIILIQLIKHPNISVSELTNKIAKSGKRIDICIVKHFLEHHGLQKKTADMLP